ncbi:MAG: hypothetical protein ABSF26_03890 [Thermoguttaceae bacterium]|jgi:hypothetical protein
MTTQELADHRPTLVDAQAAVRRFLKQALPGVRRVDVIKVLPFDSGDGAWEAEAVVWQPNATIQSLGLATRRPVLDQSCYQLRLDRHLNVIAYETAAGHGVS